MKKYELTNVTCYYTHDKKPPVILHRIRALKDFGRVKAGDLGGWIENELNLSHRGSCWVFNDAMIFNCGAVDEDATIGGTSKVYEYAVVSGSACILKNAEMSGHAYIQDHAVIAGDSKVKDNASIMSSAHIWGKSVIAKTAILTGDASVNDCIVEGNAYIGGKSSINTYFGLNTTIIGEDANIFSDKHYFVSKNPYQDGEYLTFYRNRLMGVSVGMCISYHNNIHDSTEVMRKYFTLKEFEDFVETRGPRVQDYYKAGIEKAKKMLF